MKAKFLTICLLLFTSQVFAEDIIIKCHPVMQKDEISVYKYSESLLGLLKKIQIRDKIEWKDWCISDNEETREIEITKFGGSCVSTPKIATNDIMSRSSFIDFVQPARQFMWHRQNGYNSKLDYKCSFIDKYE